jgi:hypothetical protein
MAPFFSRCSFISGSPPPVWKFREIHETREYRGFSYRGERLKIVLRTWFNEGIRDWRGLLPRDRSISNVTQSLAERV